MQQIFEARYYIRKAEELGRPHLLTSHEAILDFLAAFRAALNSYAKCFVSTGPGRVKLQDADLFSGDIDKSAHQRIMNLRHKYVSHSDSNEFEEVHVIEETSDDELIVSLEYDLKFSFDRLYELRSLIDNVEGHIVDRLEKLKSAITRDTGKRVRIRVGQ